MMSFGFTLRRTGSHGISAGVVLDAEKASVCVVRPKEHVKAMLVETANEHKALGYLRICIFISLTVF